MASKIDGAEGQFLPFQIPGNTTDANEQNENSS